MDEFNALVAHLKYERFGLDYTYVVAATIMAYDHLLTLDQEIRLVWKSPWNYTKVLFLLTRYLPVMISGLVIYDQIWVNVSPETCEKTYPLSCWLILILTNITAQVVLAIRTWALWRQDRRVLIFLITLLLGGSIGQCITMASFTNSLVFSPIPYDGYRGCFITAANTDLVWDYVILMVIEATLLTFMAISALKTHKKGGDSNLMHVIHRDGILFYLYMIAFSLANVLVIKLLPPSLIGLLSPLEAILYSVLTCRIIFNIRETAGKGTLETMHLHTRYHEPPLLHFDPRSPDLPDDIQMTNTHWSAV